MNKEQLIEQLRILSDRLPQSGMDEERLKVETSISELEAKLANNDNYTENAKFYNARDLLNRRNNYERASNALTAAQHEQESIEKSLAAAEKEQSDYQASNQARREELLQTQQRIGRELRAMVNVTPEQNDDINNRLREVREAIATIDARNNELLSNIDSYREDLANQQDVVEKATAKMEKYRQMYDSYRERADREDENVNVLAKIKDEEEIARLRQQKEALEGEYTYSNMDLREEISMIIDDLNNDEITVEDALNSLRSYRERSISNETLENATVDRENELNKLSLAYNNLTMEISDLETKLSDSNNYLVSGFVTEINEDRLANAQANRDDLESEITRVRDQIAFIDEGININSRKISTAQMTIDLANDEIAHYSAEKSRLDPATQQDQIQALDIKIARCQGEIAIQQKLTTDLMTENKISSEQKNNAQSLLNVKEDRFNRYNELVQRMEKTNAKEVDGHLKRLDENKLAGLKASRDAIEKRMEFLKFDFAENLDKILNAEPIEDVEEPNISPATNTDVQSAPNVAPVNSTQNNPEVAPLNNVDSKNNATATPAENDPNKTNSTVVNNNGNNATPTSAPKNNNGSLSTVENEIVLYKPASEHLKTVAKKKGILARISEKLKRFGKHLKENWKKYVVAGVAILGIAAAVKHNYNTTIQPVDNPIDDIPKDRVETESTVVADKTDIENAVDAAIDSVDGQEVSKEKTNEELAREVIKGLWGNGEERRQALEKEGYNYGDVQRIVDQMMSQSNNKQTPSNNQQVNADNTVTNPSTTPSQVTDQTPTQQPSGNIIDEKVEIVEDNVTPAPTPSDEVVHEQTPDTSIQPGEEITGGEVIGSVVEDVTNGDIQDETQSSPEVGGEIIGEEITGGEVIGEEQEEVTSENTVTPDTGSGDVTTDETQDVTPDESQETVEVTGGEQIGEDVEIVEDNVVLPETTNYTPAPEVSTPAPEVSAPDTSAPSQEEQSDEKQDVVHLNEGESYEYNDGNDNVIVDASGNVSGESENVEVQTNDDGSADVFITGGEQIGEDVEVVEEADLSSLLEELNPAEQLEQSKGGI